MGQQWFNPTIVEITWIQKNYRRNRRRTRRRMRRNNGPTMGPRTQLRRTFRSFQTIEINNTTGTGANQYAYYSNYIAPKPEEAFGFRDAQTTFEFGDLIGSELESNRD